VPASNHQLCTPFQGWGIITIEEGCMVPDPLIWGPSWGFGGSFHDDGSELVISASQAQGSRQSLYRSHCFVVGCAFL
jgi:hypothetical protein